MTIFAKTCLLIALAVAQAPVGAPSVREKKPANTAYLCDTDAARALVGDLAGDASVVEVGCAASGDELRARNELLARFVEVARSGSGTFRLKKTCTTIEGDPIVRYLVVDDGSITLATDSTADKFGPKQVCRAGVDQVELGYFDPKTADASGPRYFQVTPDSPADATYLIRCYPQEWDF